MRACLLLAGRNLKFKMKNFKINVQFARRIVLISAFCLWQKLQSFLIFICAPAIFPSFSGCAQLSETDMKTLEKKRPILKKARKALNDISLDSRTRLAYDRRKSTIFFYEKTLEKKFDEGKAEGIQKGVHEKAIATAWAMLGEGEPIEKIARYTGLSIEEIANLK